MWFLFVPLLIVLALLFVMGSLVAGLFGLLGAAWPVLLIGAGVWLFWHEDGSHRRSRRGQIGWPSAVSTGVGDVAATAARARTEARAKPEKKPRKWDPRGVIEPELPIDIQVRAEQIRRKVDVLLGYAERFPPFSQDLYLVRQTANEYLPRTISAYLAMPRDSADKPVASDGKTARQELKAQLDLLDARLEDIAQDLQRQDTDRLLANRRFLEDRFGMREANGPKLDSEAVGVA